ncbi:MAG: Fic family protein [Moritella sp.]|jgi:Fic family protein
MSEKQKISELKDSILEVLTGAEGPLSRGNISERLLTISHQLPPVSPKTLQRRLQELCEAGKVESSGNRSAKKYALARPISSTLASILVPATVKNSSDIIAEETSHNYENSYAIARAVFSKASREKLKYLDTPSFGRKKTAYNAALIESYVPNKTPYISNEMRKSMRKAGVRFDKELAAGTYAKNIVQRLLIDLSYNSSRLEGNTYSLLDTKKLLEKGVTADGSLNEEAVMILNHKEAILFLVENALEIEVTPFVIKNLHQLLSQDLLANASACGKVRQMEVGISRSAYIPLNNPQRLEEYLVLTLRKAQQIIDPFEQSFFLLMHLSYLQAFEDVNKRTARLTCNIPFIKMNLCPLSFVDVTKEDYINSLLYFYETGDTQPAADVFHLAYLSSCDKYTVVKASLGQIDVYRVKFRRERKEALGDIIREMLTGHEIESSLENYCDKNQIDEKDKFISIAIAELNNIHSGAIIGLGITEGMFNAWLKKKELSSNT